MVVVIRRYIKKTAPGVQPEAVAQKNHRKDVQGLYASTMIADFPPKSKEENMAKKAKYAELYTLRADGRYQGWYRDRDGKRHAVYDRDPEVLHRKLAEKEAAAALPLPEITFRSVAESWEEQHREEIEVRTWKNYKPHLEQILDEYGDLPFSRVEAADVAADLARAKARGLGASVVNARRSIWRMIYDYAVILGAAFGKVVNAVVEIQPGHLCQAPEGTETREAIRPDRVSDPAHSPEPGRPLRTVSVFAALHGPTKERSPRSELDGRGSEGERAPHHKEPGLHQRRPPEIQDAEDGGRHPGRAHHWNPP